MKKLIILVFVLIGFISFDFTYATSTINFLGSSSSSVGPDVAGAGLPGSSSSGEAIVSTYIPRIITTIIKYTAVIAVISIIISGIMYMLSFGREDKAKKAKSWIIYSLVGVLISVSAYAIINLINSIKL
ncbi:MAG: hypothetical protein PHR68_00130 [Candidatus Gracilibacteria bacterium]|nr:hypothetical protein [Candidatus Gracilibacteria bacterium]